MHGKHCVVNALYTFINIYHFCSQCSFSPGSIQVLKGAALTWFHMPVLFQPDGTWLPSCRHTNTHSSHWTGWNSV